MAVSKDNRDLGQRAATLSGVAILLKSLNYHGDAPGVVSLLKITGMQDAAVLTGCAGCFMTFYFLLNVWADHLNGLYEHEAEAEILDAASAQPLSGQRGARMFSNVTFQPWIENSIALIDFWLPLILAVLALTVLWGDGYRIVVKLITQR